MVDTSQVADPLVQQAGMTCSGNAQLSNGPTTSGCKTGYEESLMSMAVAMPTADARQRAVTAIHGCTIEYG